MVEDINMLLERFNFSEEESIRLVSSNMSSTNGKGYEAWAVDIQHSLRLHGSTGGFGMKVVDNLDNYLGLPLPVGVSWMTCNQRFVECDGRAKRVEGFGLCFRGRKFATPRRLLRLSKMALVGRWEMAQASISDQTIGVLKA
ncbi:hypothetical protein Golax_022831 [Gossypium laxum]|uniref:Uncharacterized protein n=1 Tax=Gossypium laxum TaxID=34288 RepID=A0A7J9B752_9ROSI|nr:hypothetical protein [Gossypium laxum]